MVELLFLINDKLQYFSYQFMISFKIQKDYTFNHILYIVFESIGMIIDNSKRNLQVSYLE